LSGNVCSDGGGCIYRSRFFVLGLQIGHLHFGIDFGSGSSLLSLLFSWRFCHGSLFGFWFLGSGSLSRSAFSWGRFTGFSRGWGRLFWGRSGFGSWLSWSGLFFG
jgi:hypothetical protein